MKLAFTVSNNYRLIFLLFYCSLFRLNLLQGAAIGRRPGALLLIPASVSMRELKNFTILC